MRNRFTIYDVPNEGKGSLGRDVWVFTFFEDRGLVLDYYAHEERDNLRQKFRPRRAYHRLSHNRDRIGLTENVPVEKAPFPEWVKDQAKEQFCAAVKVVLWKD